MHTGTAKADNQPTSQDLRPLLTLLAFGGVGLLVWTGLFVALYRSVAAAWTVITGM
jgi:hypothetical protein